MIDRPGWEWDERRRRYFRKIPGEDDFYHIYPTDDGYMVSSYDCWHEGMFETFEEAERELFA